MDNVLLRTASNISLVLLRNPPPQFSDLFVLTGQTSTLRRHMMTLQPHATYETRNLFQ